MGDLERVELRMASSLIFFDNITIQPVGRAGDKSRELEGRVFVPLN